MKNRRSLRSARLNKGATLTELLIAALLLSFSMAVISQIMYMLVISSNKLTNYFDASSAARFAILRIKNDVQSANTFLSAERNSFTLETLDRYVSSTNDPSKAGYDSSASWDPLNGMPLVKDGVPARSQIKYEVVSSGGLWSLVREVNSKKQTVLTGIQGPRLSGVASDQPPSIFRYFEGVPEGTMNMPVSLSSEVELAANVKGLRLDLEVKKPGSLGNPIFDKNLATHAEVFVRSHIESPYVEEP